MKLLQKHKPEAFEYFPQLVKIGKLALTTTTESAWRDYLRGFCIACSLLERDQACMMVAELATTVAQLQQLNVLDVWLNSAFINGWNKTQGNLIKRCYDCSTILTNEAKKAV